MNRWLIVALIFAVAGGGLFMAARGVRNRNPGNIRHGRSQWVGMAATQTDPDYVQFTDAKYGIRAMTKLLRNYQARYGLNTVHGIISRWAPPEENITAAYIAAVAKDMNVAPALYLRLQDPDIIFDLVKAIIKHENGTVPYSDETITRGIALA